MYTVYTHVYGMHGCKRCMILPPSQLSPLVAATPCFSFLYSFSLLKITNQIYYILKKTKNRSRNGKKFKI